MPACSSVGEPFSEIGRESAPPVALNGEIKVGRGEG